MKAEGWCGEGALKRRLAGLLLALMSAFLLAGCDDNDRDSLPAARPSTGINGHVTQEAVSVGGIMVRARAQANGVETTVFTDRAGRFHLALNPGKYRVEAMGERHYAAKDVTVPEQAAVTLDIALAPDPGFLQRIASDRWMTLLPEGEMKREFILNCASCHEIDAGRVLVNGVPRSDVEWEPTKCAAREKTDWLNAVELMRAIDDYNLLPPDFDDARYAAWLAQHLGTEQIKTLTPRPAPDPAAMAGIVITEYPLPMDGSLPHDLVVGPDGRIWITAFFYDLIWALDPKTGAYETFKIRPDDAADWGQTRALVFDTAGHLWIVLGGTHELVRLDPRDRSFNTYDVGMYAHSLALDAEGRIWINDYFAEKERIGVFDPKTETVRHIDVPSANLSAAEGLPLPYGLQVDKAGRVYSTQLAANTLVLHDIASGQSKLYQMPAANSGPRRPAVGTDGMLWIPEWNTGYLTRFDPKSETFTRFAIGSSALGAYDAEVDPRSGEIWVTGALSASMFLFDPGTASTLEIPLPTNPAYTRHLAVDPKTGDLWSAYSSLPAAQPKVVRIERRARQ
ncbi:MAG: hypothetical protein Tsb0016_10380 [Sphingomonadales bacterium]